MKFKFKKECKQVRDDAANGSAIRKMREAAGISLRELAREMCIQPPSLSDLERGNRSFTPTRFNAAKSTIKEILKHNAKNS